MKLVIQGKNIDITDPIRSYVEEKINKAVSHFQSFITEVDVHLSVARNPRIHDTQIAEVTVYANGSVIRAEESSENLYASLDLVADKLSRKLRKYKEKRQTISHERPQTDSDAPELLGNLVNDQVPELPKAVIRRKYFAMPPMSVEEALEHLEMVDHDFFVFYNQDTQAINVIYERNHGGYGLIQPRPHTNGHAGRPAPHKSQATPSRSHS